MTNCNQFKEAILDYVDGLMTPEQKKMVTKHLDECSHCRDFYDETKHLRSQLKQLKPIRISSDFETVLRTRISMEKSLSRRGIATWPVKLPLYVAAGALIFMAALLFYNNILINGQSANTLSFYSTTLAGDKSDDQIPNVSQKVYTMDKIMMRGQGTPLNSESITKNSGTPPDSVKNNLPLRSVAIEF